MFDERLQNLFGSNSPVKKVEYTTSGNGALKLTSTGDPFVDQFGLISQYRQLRPYSSISKDMQELWDIDPMYTLKLLFYIRLITRKVKFHNGTETSKVQKGAGLRHEAFMRMLWLAVNRSETFYKNLPLLTKPSDKIIIRAFEEGRTNYLPRVIDGKNCRIVVMGDKQYIPDAAPQQ